MWRFLAGGAAMLLMMTAGIFIWNAWAGRPAVAPAPSTAEATPMGLAGLAPPPAASERTREEKRFARYDRDRNGAVAREEYLLGRRKAFAKLDTNGDGKLEFEEYAIKTTGKFAAADKDRNGALNPAEFATTRVVRKPQPKCNCTPVRREAVPAEEPEEN